jgi:hypothetical protein
VKTAQFQGKLASGERYKADTEGFFPKEAVEGNILGGHNYCRNPDKKSGGIWCYTASVEVRLGSAGRAPRRKLRWLGQSLGRSRWALDRGSGKLVDWFLPVPLLCSSPFVWAPRPWCWLRGVVASPLHGCPSPWSAGFQTFSVRPQTPWDYCEPRPANATGWGRS